MFRFVNALWFPKLNSVDGHGQVALIGRVVPIKDVRIQVKTDTDAKAVTTATGQEARFERDGEWLRVNLVCLQEYDVVLVDLV